MVYRLNSLVHRVITRCAKIRVTRLPRRRDSGTFSAFWSKAAAAAGAAPAEHSHWSGAAMSGLFSLDDVKLLYQASQIPDGDDEKKSASLVPKMQNLGPKW